MPVQIADSYVEKRLSSRERDEPEAVRRLRSEAALLGALSASGARDVTPRLLGRGEDARGPWHRVERVLLPTVAAHVASRGVCDAMWIERAARSSLAALAALHEAEDADGPLAVVHADLSPANLAIDVSGARAVFLDFDLASWRDRGPARDGAFRGTIAYTAPEVARGEHATAVSDLFSLGAVLLCAATAKAPRGGSSFAALLAAAAEVPVVGPDELALAGRGAGHAALLRCLEHEPSRRPRSARAALSTLLPVC